MLAATGLEAAGAVEGVSVGVLFDAGFPVTSEGSCPEVGRGSVHDSGAGLGCGSECGSVVGYDGLCVATVGGGVMWSRK